MTRSTFFRFRFPVAVLLIGLSFTAVVAGLIHSASSERDRVRFEKLADAQAKAIQERTNFYALMVRGVAGLFTSGAEIRGETFDNYVKRLKIKDRYTGVESFGWNPRVLPEKRDEFLKWARAELAPDYKIWPETDGPAFPLVYTAPAEESAKQVLGFNPASEANRRSTIEDCVRTGKARITAPIRLMRERTTPLGGPVDPERGIERTGFALFAPVYASSDIPETPELREEAVVGMCGGGFRSIDLLNDIFGGEPPTLQIDLFDGGAPDEQTPMAHFRENSPEHSPRYADWRIIEVWGRVWSLKFSSRPEFEMAGEFLWTPFAALLGVLGSLTAAEMSRRRLVMAGELAMSRADLVRLNRELERRVADRTKLAEERAERLRTLSEELINAEQRERGRIAQILHDDLQQILVAAKMRLAIVSAQRPDVDVQPAVDLILRAIHTGRSLSTQLEPGIIKDRGLAAALEWAAKKAKENHGLEVQTTIDESAEPRSESMKTFLLRAAQEALLNVVKHAGVNSAELKLRQLNDDYLELVISDKGAGCAEDALSKMSSEHFGLFSIKNRIELLGGGFEISATNGSGCRIRLTAPLADPTTPMQTAAVSSGEFPLN